MRQYMAVVMFVSCIANIHFLSKYYNKYIGLFLLFIFFYLICSIPDDGFEQFFRLLISAYCVGLVAYFATILYMDRVKQYGTLINILLLCGLINGTVTLLQYIHHPIGLAIGAFFIDADNDQKLASFSHVMDGESGYALMGMLGDAVQNAYIMLLMPLLVIERIYNNKVTLHRVLYLLLFIFFFVALFAIQERSALLVALVVCIGFLYIKFNKRNKLLLLAALGFVILLVPLIMAYDFVTESRFVEDRSEEPRLMIYLEYISYLLTHPIFGGLNEPFAKIGLRPHNIVLNAFCYAGLFGGTIVLYLILKQSLFCISMLKKDLCIGFSLCFIGFTLNGLFHNNSVVAGDVIIWIIWGVIYFVFKNRNIDYAPKSFRRNTRL